ncbi:hypothetical protein DZA28_06680 [Pseudomonas alloputida]|uniref:Uncharacterized protein n=2 Tax=Pseudomonas TaxID=286 RepID=A0ABD6MZ89_9PSED|nr:hypothetical protein [Pseudomonas hunanensis]TRZ59660.1 hypothetical protein DZA28_06680 [Pseudomonas alloputida]
MAVVLCVVNEAWAAFAGLFADKKMRKACAVARRSGFTREWARPAGQSPPAVHRCRRHRIRG